MIYRVLDSLWKVLASIKTGMVLIGLIALVNLGGSFIIQEDQAPPGQIERSYSPEVRSVLESLGLFDLYHSWWFILLLMLTAVSLIVASIDIWPRFWERAVAWQPILTKTQRELQPLRRHVAADCDGPELMARVKKVLGHHFRQVWSEGTSERFGHIFAQKGRWSHLGVFVIHTGLLLVLIGGAIGSKFGFEGQVRLREGDASNIFIDERGRGEARPLGFTVRCQDVRMEQYPDGSPKAYYSDLEILQDGEVVKSQTIKVNDPLSYDGIYFYQATYGTEPVAEAIQVQLSITERRTGKTHEVMLPLGEEQVMPGGQKGPPHFAVLDFRPNFSMPIEGVEHELGHAVLVRVQGQAERTFWIFEKLPEFDATMRQGDYAFVLKGVRPILKAVEFSGLAVGYNPGIGIVWTGSIILLGGLMWTFLGSHRKVWVTVEGKNVYLAGRAHRNPDSFAKEFERLGKSIEAVLGEEQGTMEPGQVLRTQET